MKYNSMSRNGTGERGSVIVLALLVLSILTLGGIIASQRSWTESRVVRNTAIHKQNLVLAETAVMEGVAELVNPQVLIESLDHVTEFAWFHNKDNLPNPNNLDDANSWVPTISLDINSGGLDILDQRGEITRDAAGVFTAFNNASLRYYASGWHHIPGGAGGGESIVDSTGGVMQRCGVVGIYESDRFGRKAIEIGVKMLREIN